MIDIRLAASPPPCLVWIRIARWKARLVPRKCKRKKTIKDVFQLCSQSPKHANHDSIRKQTISSHTKPKWTPSTKHQRQKRKCFQFHSFSKRYTLRKIELRVRSIDMSNSVSSRITVFVLLYRLFFQWSGK